MAAEHPGGAYSAASAAAPSAASSPGAGGFAPITASTPFQLSAMPECARALCRRTAGDVRVEGAVEHARGVLGARQVAAEPEQLLGDPG